MNKDPIEEIKQLKWAAINTALDKKLIESMKSHPFSRHSVEVLQGYGYDAFGPTVTNNIRVEKPSIGGALENLRVIIRYFWIKRFGV